MTNIWFNFRNISNSRKEH